MVIMSELNDVLVHSKLTLVFRRARPLHGSNTSGIIVGGRRRCLGLTIQADALQSS